jgi:hypothetical protein
MSVALLIKNPLLDTSSLVPIAGESTFRECWITPAIALGLRWLPLFQSGQSVPFEVLPEVIDEFETIERSFRSSGSLAMAERAAGACHALRAVLNEAPDSEVFIG